MKVSITESSSTVRQISVEMPQDAVKASYKVRFDKYRKNVDLPGFRKGKVPPAMLEARYGEAIRQEAVEDTIDKVVKEELTKANINPVAPGRIETFNDDKVNPITFTLIVEVDPVIDIQNYSDLGVVVESVEISEEEIAEELNLFRRRLATDEVAERAAAQGDIVVGDYLALKIDGEDKDLPENAAFRIEIGATKVPELDVALTGVQAGEEKQFAFTFPADYHVEELGGKSAEYKLVVKEIRAVVLPEIDDELAKKAGEESTEALKAKFKSLITDAKSQVKKNEAREKALNILLEKNVFEVPHARAHNVAERMLNKENATHEEIHEIEPQAVIEIRKHRILDFIATKENLKPSQVDVDARIEQMAAQYGFPFEELKAHLRSSGKINEIREELRIEKALDFIVGVRD